MRRKSCWLRDLSAVLLVLFGAVSLIAPAQLSVEVAVDDHALPLLVSVSVSGGSAPYRVSLECRSAFDEPIEVSCDGVESSSVFALPTNRRGTVVVSVSDANANSEALEVVAGKDVLQGQAFVLDGGRFKPTSSGVERPVWDQLFPQGLDEYWSSTELAFSSEGQDLVEASAAWPGTYRLRYGEETLDVFVSGSSSVAIRGMCDDYAPRGLGYTNLDEHFEHMRRVGINAIQFMTKFSMESVTDTAIHAASPFPYWDSLLECAMRQAKRHGFTVMLRFCLGLDADWPEADNLQDGLQPSDWDAWFAQYSEYVLKYAELAERAGCDIYAFSDTLQTTYVFEQRYRSLIARIRDCFTGQLTVLTGPDAPRLDEISFWDALDYIGIDGSLHTARHVDYDNAADLSTADVYEMFKADLESEILPTARTYGKPVLWGEVYYRSVLRSTYCASGLSIEDFTAMHAPGASKEFEIVKSYAEQAKGYDAMLRLVQEYQDVIAGLFALHWPLVDPIPLWCCNHGSHIIPFTPAEAVFSSWWSQSQHDDLRAAGDTDEGCSEYVDFSWEAPYRGFWAIDAFGDSSAQFQTSESGPDASPVEFLTFEYSNPNDYFLRLRYVLNSEETDYSDYQGVVLALASLGTARLQIELSFGEWTGAYSPPLSVGTTTSLIKIPFERFVVPEEDVAKECLASNRPDTCHIAGISILPLDTAGALYVYGLGVYR